MPHARGMGRVSEQAALWIFPASEGCRVHSFQKEGLPIKNVLTAALDHPGLFLRNGVGQSRAVEHDLPGVARAVVNPDLDVIGRRRKWLWIADDAQTAVEAREQFAGKEVFQGILPVANV